MANGRFVSYLRVSTDRQGRSGLGLEAQRAAVTNYLNGGSWSLVAEIVEVESGRKAKRPELNRALSLCRAHRATLVVAKVDRLTRSVAFLSRLIESGVEVRFCDLPQIEGPTGRFMLTQLAAVAELEAGLISVRTTAALAAAKERGQKLGGDRGDKRYVGTPEDTAKARAARSEKASARAGDIAPILARLDPDGTASLRALAAALTAEGIDTPSGRGAWTPIAVARLQKRIANGVERKI